MQLQIYISCLLVTFTASVYSAGQSCEVCVKTLEKFRKQLPDNAKKNPELIEKEFREFCKKTKNKENTFCYYLGGLETSATGILTEMSKPLSWGMPVDKVCQKLKKKDGQICDLKYDVEIDIKTANLKKLKVRDLKRVLNDWDEVCEGCIEKDDYIRRIEELKHKHVEL